MRKYLLLLCLPLLMGSSWDGGGAGFEDEPADGDQLSAADDRMREIKNESRLRAEVEHWWGNGFAPPGDTDDNGLHRVGAARCFLQSVAPTALGDSMSDYLSVTSTRIGETDLDDSASGSGLGAADDLGHGRCWIDLDDGKMYVFVGVAGDGNGGWVPVSGAGTGTHSLVYNGNFNATDGTGLVAATAVPAGWAASAGESATYSYTDPSSDTDWGEGLMAVITNAGAVDEGIQYEMDAMPKGATYLVVARALDDGTAVCTLGVSGNGGAAFAALTGEVIVTAGGGAWTTLMGTFGTDAAALDDDVLLDLETTGADTLVCSYSNVNVYKIDGPEVSQGGTTVVSVTDTTTTAALAAALADVAATLTVAVTPPRQGCIVEFNSSIAVNYTATDQVSCVLEEDDGSAAVFGRAGHSVTGSAGVVSLYSSGITVNPAPGTTITYTPQCMDGGGGSSSSVCNSATVDCNLWVKMTCGGN